MCIYISIIITIHNIRLFIIQLIYHLFHTYGFKGGILILGALQAHTCCCGLIYRPLISTNKADRSIKTNIKEDDEELYKMIKDSQPTRILNVNANKELEFSTVETKNTNEGNSIPVSFAKRCWNGLRCVGNFIDIQIWTDSRFTLFALSQGFNTHIFYSKCVII